MIPRTGGNNFSGTYFLSYAGEWAQASNLDDELRSYGITEVPALIKNWDTNFALGGPIKRDRLWFFGNVRSFGIRERRAGSLRQRERRQSERVHLRRGPEHQGAQRQLQDDWRDPPDRSGRRPRTSWASTTTTRRTARGSAFTEDGEQCRDRGDDWVALGAIGGFGSNSPEAGNQVWDDREKIVQATWTSHGDQQAAPRGRPVVLQQPLEPVPRRRRGPEHRLDHRADRHAGERHSGAVLHLPLDGESARQRPAAQRVARVGVVRDRLAQHEGRLSGRLPGAEAVHDRQPEHDQLHLPRRRALVAHAVHPESVQQPHALRRVLRPGSVDGESLHGAGRASIRARVELVPRG